MDRRWQLEIRNIIARGEQTPENHPRFVAICQDAILEESDKDPMPITLDKEAIARLALRLQAPGKVRKLGPAPLNRAVAETLAPFVVEFWEQELGRRAA